MAERTKAKTIALWVVSGVLAALYLMAGGSKLAGVEMHVKNFARWGWPDGMRVVVGAVEVTSAVLILMPRTAFVGACALMLVMAGATYTHLFRATGEGGMAVATLVLLGLAALVAHARRPDSLRRGKRAGG